MSIPFDLSESFLKRLYDEYHTIHHLSEKDILELWKTLENLSNKNLQMIVDYNVRFVSTIALKILLKRRII